MADEFEPSLNWPPEGRAGATPPPQLDAELKYQAGNVPELDQTLSTLAGQLGQGDQGPAPWVATKPSARRARLVRRFIIIDVVLLVAVVIAGLTFRSSPTHLTPTAPAAAPQSLLPAGTVSMLAGPTCAAGTTRADVELTVVRALSGLYYVAASGAVVPRSGGALHDVTVTWAVQYADGYEATAESAVNAGRDIGVSQSAAWSARLSHSEGTVPPSAVRLVGISGAGTLTACR